jgi:uncharacterized protein (TIGR00725 family)
MYRRMIYPRQGVGKSHLTASRKFAASKVLGAKIPMRKIIVSVNGGHNCTSRVEQEATKLGKKLAKVADILVSGGLSGVMLGVCKGFKAGGGVTLGIIPGYDKSEANSFVDIVLPTGMGLARNVLVVKSADVVVALPGEAGTLSEIAYCLQFGIPVISLGSWDIPGVIKVDTVEKAVEKVKITLNGSKRSRL